MRSTLVVSAVALAVLLPAIAAAQTSPNDAGRLLDLAEASLAAGRPLEAAEHARKATTLAPKQPTAWYELGRAYDAVAKYARATFDQQSEQGAWRELIVADRLLAGDQLAAAFVAYREIFQQLPGMVSIRDSIVTIYERSGHPDWAAQERTLAAGAGVDCERRKAMCQFRAGQYASALSAGLAAPDPESRYWTGRAAEELAKAAYKTLDSLPDSSERHVARAATLAGVQRRFTEAIVELKAAMKLTPGNPVLVFQLASMAFGARDFEQTIAVLYPLVRATPDDPRIGRLLGLSLLELHRIDEAIPVLQHVLAKSPADSEVRLGLGLAQLQNGNYAAAAPLLEPGIGADTDGSVHMQLGRAYIGLGQREKGAALLEEGQAIQRRANEQRAAAAQKMIVAPGK